jgi:hypothetical protein
VLDVNRVAFQSRWNGTISTTPNASAFYFPNVFSTAFSDVRKPYYLYDVASQGTGTETSRRAAVLRAVRSGVVSASSKLGQFTAAGNRTGISVDLFMPMYPVAINASGTEYACYHASAWCQACVGGVHLDF